MISGYGSFYFNGFLAILSCMIFGRSLPVVYLVVSPADLSFPFLLYRFVLEAVRQVRSQNAAYQELKSNPSIFKPETEAVYLMKLFRAQRNLYISGFSILLWLYVLAFSCSNQKILTNAKQYFFKPLV